MVDFFVDGYFELSFAVAPLSSLLRDSVATISTISGVSSCHLCY